MHEKSVPVKSPNKSPTTMTMMFVPETPNSVTVTFILLQFFSNHIKVCLHEMFFSPLLGTV